MVHSFEPRLDDKSLYRRIEQVLAGVAPGLSRRRLVEQIARRSVEHLGPRLHIAAAEVYDRRARGLVRTLVAGEDRPDLAPELTAWIRTLDEEAPRELPALLETSHGPVGLVPFGFQESPLFAFRFALPEDAGDGRKRSIVSSLEAFHYALTQHLRRRELEDIFEQARAIQMSLLPAGRPSFVDFDIVAESRPAHSVGGDFYDFIRIDDDTLVLTVADASGHGLPAALQARDVATGLRMGVARDLKINRTIERLNRVIYQSGLASRFISLVFAELEKNGNLAYVNAGHPPPLLLDDRGFHELSVGGMVLGPRVESTYKFGFTHMDRGSALALYSDGVMERRNAAGEEFGIDGIQRWLSDWRSGPGEAAVPDLFRRLLEFNDNLPFDDDVTVVYVRRPPRVPAS